MTCSWFVPKPQETTGSTVQRCSLVLGLYQSLKKPLALQYSVTHLFLVCTKASRNYWLHSTTLLTCSWFVPKPQGTTGSTVQRYSLVLGLYQSLEELLALQYNVTHLFLVCTKASRNYWLYSTTLLTCSWFVPKPRGTTGSTVQRYSLVLGLCQSLEELLALQYSATHLFLVCTKASRNHWFYSTLLTCSSLYQSLNKPLALQYNITHLFLVCTKASRNYWLYSTVLFTCSWFVPKPQETTGSTALQRYSLVLGLYPSGLKEPLSLQCYS